MAITDITNVNTTAGAITRGIELGIELVGFGLLCGVKKDTKEIRKTETDILAKARNIESDIKVTKTNTSSVLNWIGKVDPVIMGTPAPASQPQQAAPTPTQQPAQPTPAPQQNIVVMPQAPAEQVVPQQETAPVQQAPVQQPASQAPVITEAQLNAAVKAAATEAASAAVAEYIAQNNTTDANKGKGGK